MIRILLDNVTPIEDLIDLIKDGYANDYRRIWSLSERVVGLFMHESIGWLAGNVYSIMTVLDYDPARRSCDLLIRYSGGALSLIGTGRSEDFISDMVRAISGLAEQKEWLYKIERAKVKPAGEECPYCGASYRYPKEKVGEDGTVECQNCGRPFAPG
ncbi:MAG: hypothetical protein ACE5H4_14835 [Candidatus Thorarchaeota archaeon]